MSKIEFSQELTTILNQVNRIISNPIAVTNTHSYARLRRARRDIEDAIDFLK